MRGLMAAASFVWRRLAVRCAPLLPCPPACSGAFQPGFLATAGPVRFGMGGRGSRVESFVTQKFQGGLGGGGRGREAGAAACALAPGLAVTRATRRGPCSAFGQDPAAELRTRLPGLFLGAGEDPIGIIQRQNAQNMATVLLLTCCRR